MRNLLICLLLLFLVALDSLAGYGIVVLNGWLKLLVFAAHGAIVVAGLFLFRQLRLDNFVAERNFRYTAFALALVLPGYGLLGTLAVALTTNRVKLQPTSYFEIDDGLAPQQHKMTLRKSHSDVIEIQQDLLDLEAFRDIFKSNDRQLEESAISKLSKLVTRQSVAILKDVVRTATSDTRVMAATALIDMEDKITRRIEALSAALEKNGSDKNKRLQLARTYDLYCYLGVLDEDIRTHYNKLAITEYRSFLIASPKHPEAIFEYGRALLSSGDTEKATRVLGSAVSLAPENPSAHVWLAEAHYESGDYSSVVAVCRRVSSFANLPEALRPVVNWWAEPEEQSPQEPPPDDIEAI